MKETQIHRNSENPYRLKFKKKKKRFIFEKKSKKRGNELE